MDLACWNGGGTGWGDYMSAVTETGPWAVCWGKAVGPVEAGLCREWPEKPRLGRVVTSLDV